MCSVRAERWSWRVSISAFCWVRKTYCSLSFFSWSCKRPPTISVSVRGTGSAIIQPSSDFSFSISMCSTPSSRPVAEVGGTITALIAPAAAESTFVSGAEPNAAATRCRASASFSSLVGILPPSLVAAFVNSIGVNPDMAQKGMRERMRKAKVFFDRDDHRFTWAKMETFCSSEHCRHIHAFQQASQAKWKSFGTSDRFDGAPSTRDKPQKWLQQCRQGVRCVHVLEPKQEWGNTMIVTDLKKPWLCSTEFAQLGSIHCPCFSDHSTCIASTRWWATWHYILLRSVCFGRIGWNFGPNFTVAESRNCVQCNYDHN